MTQQDITIKPFAELTTNELYEILKARFSVFVVEQHCFYLDLDDIDYRSLHLFIRDGREVTAYARLFEEEESGSWHIGRVLTTRRGVGLGRRIMEAVVQTAHQHGAERLRMEAQAHAVGFYERLGFHVCSSEFEEAGIPHVRMERPSLRDIYLAGGCFWGTEHFFKQIAGVVATEVGFANGHTANPTYKEVYTDTTGHAETVHVRYDPSVVSLTFLLRMFFKTIDPTALNRQGHDEGTRYRTGVYYTDPSDLPVIEQVFAEEQARYSTPLAVEKRPLQNFYTAEEYHQDYLDKNPDGYCHLPLSLFEFARRAREERLSI